MDTLNLRCRIIIGTQNGTLILTTAHVSVTRDMLVFGQTDRALSDYQKIGLLESGLHDLGKRAPEIQVLRTL